MEKFFESRKLYIAFIITFFIIVIYSLISQFIYGDTIFNLIRLFWQELLLSIFIINISYMVRYLRWRFLLFSIGLKPNNKRDIINWLASFSFAATPGKIGELVRINFYKKDFNISRSKIFSILAIEKISDLLSILLICIISLNFISSNNYVFMIYLFIFALSLMLIIYKNKRIFKQFIKLFLSRINNNSFLGLYNSFKDAAKFQVLIISLFIGSIGWFIECLGIYKLFNYLKEYDLSLLQVAFAHTSSSLVGLISLIPGGIAATEFTTSKILINHGLPINDAIIYSFLIRIITIWYGTILGFLLLFIRLINRRKNNSLSIGN